MNIDLHTHTSASDGALTPPELVARAAAAGVELLAITDHDTVAGLAQLQAPPPALRIIQGVEFSTCWRKVGIHVLGLNINCDHPVLQDGLAQQRRARDERARIIAARLAKLGLGDVLTGAREQAGAAAVGRPHLAQQLVAAGHVKDHADAFRRYLGRGKPGDVRETWAELPQVIEWISAAGGYAVLAHPAKYKLSNLRLEELTRDFAAAGGHGIEVVCGRQDTALTRRLGKLAQRHGLLASCGSDFHGPGPHRPEVGEVGLLPAGCRPVWESW
ncbi:MAG: PHP domain-containing protein [Gammaproteobacteria bacterium]|jgi:predicted metal-dependent phosphoesterase TrpH|nr:PHP domain-containing protein [Gammaproteobacteria bacterium]